MSSKIIFFCLFSCLFGIIFGILFSKLFWLVFLTPVLFFKRIRLIFILLVFCFILGFLRADFFQKEISQNALENFYNKNVSFKGKVIDSSKEEKITVFVKEMQGSEIAKEEKVLIHLSSFEKYDYGDHLKIKGLLEEAPVFDTFDYREYLGRKGILALMYEPEIKKLNSSFSFYKKVLEIREKLFFTIQENYQKQQAQLLGAMLLGKKSEIDDELKEKLNFAGIRHLTAISGMHTIILVNALMYLFLAIGLWRKQAFFLTVLFIVLFIVLTGFQPSTIRASIMAFMLLLAQAVGRLSDSTRAIVLTALAMLFINPFLIYDIGFQLSFLAVLGINYMFPILTNYLEKIPKTIRNILIMTLSAQIFTLPILIYNFGYISLIAPITNLLILPILPFILILGFLSLFLGIIFIFATHILLTYLIKVSEIFSSFTFSSINLSFPIFLFVVYYIFLIYFIYSYRKKNRFKIIVI
jgi:competence protein ComEC